MGISVFQKSVQKEVISACTMQLRRRGKHIISLEADNLCPLLGVIDHLLALDEETCEKGEDNV